MQRQGCRSVGLAATLVIVLQVLGCSSGDLLKVPLLSVTVQVVDEKDQPVSGAIVEVTNGEQLTTGADGKALLRFGALGIHQVTVMAQDRVPSTFTVSMPMDRGKTVTARLGVPVQMSANINVSGGLGGLMMGQIYPMLFQSLFVAQGYSMEMSPYREGEWTEWNVHSGPATEKPMAMRKAYLTRTDKGQEWWQVRLVDDTPDETITLEVLFAPEKESIRRMRQRTGNGEPQEVPVAEGWYSRPVQLTRESIEGAITERGVQVTVPAGTFTADRLRFGQLGLGGKGALSIWRVPTVPGGVVKAELTEEDGAVAWTTQLTAHGSGAKTELASY